MPWKAPAGVILWTSAKEELSRHDSKQPRTSQLAPSPLARGPQPRHNRCRRTLQLVKQMHSPLLALEDTAATCERDLAGSVHSRVAAYRVPLLDNARGALIYFVVIYHACVLYSSADRPEALRAPDGLCEPNSHACAILTVAERSCRHRSATGLACLRFSSLWLCPHFASSRDIFRTQSLRRVASLHCASWR